MCVKHANYQLRRKRTRKSSVHFRVAHMSANEEERKREEKKLYRTNPDVTSSTGIGRSCPGSGSPTAPLFVWPSPAQLGVSSRHFGTMMINMGRKRMNSFLRS